MVTVYDVWLLSGPPSRFRALIRKQQMWLLYKPVIAILRTLLSTQRESQETQKNVCSFIFENGLYLPSGWFYNELYKI